MATIEFVVCYDLISCANCGICFGVDQRWRSQRLNDHRTFFCPNGHDQSYPAKSEAEIARAHAQQIEQKLQAQINEERHAKLAAQKEIEDLKKKQRKMQSRISRGVCTCCNRTFEDLARHMASKHSNIIPSNEQKQITAGA